jgi:parallel beta-helix repeat protein
MPFTIKTKKTLSKIFIPFSIIIFVIGIIAYIFNTSTCKNKLDTYKFTLSNSDTKFFKKAIKDNFKTGYMAEKSSKEQKVELAYKNKNYKVKMALRGDAPNHWNSEKISFKIKTSKDNAIDNKTKWSFIIACDRNYFIPQFSNFAAKKLNLPALDTKLGFVTINNKEKGIYFIEQGVNTEFLETNGFSNCFVVKLNSPWSKDHSPQFDKDKPQTLSWPWSAGLEYGHTTPFNLEISNLDDINSEQEQAIKYRVNQLFSAIKNNNIKTISSMIDSKNIGAYMAVLSLMGSAHDASGDNLRFIYSLTSGKFSLIPRFEGMVEELRIENGSFESSINTKRFNPMLFNDKVRSYMYSYIADLIANKKNLLTEYKSLKDKYLPIILKDPIPIITHRKIKRIIKKSYKRLKHNLNVLEKVISYSKCYIDMIVENNSLTIEIMPDSNAPLKCEQFDLILPKNITLKKTSIDVFDSNMRLITTVPVLITDNKINIKNIINKNLLITSLDKNLHIQKTIYTYKIKNIAFESLTADNFKIKMSNNATKKHLEQNELYIGIASGKHFYPNAKIKSIDEFLKLYNKIPFVKNNNEIILNSGEYEIKQNIIIPQNTKVILNPGVSLKIHPNISILSYSPIEILGTKENPITITSYKKDKPFGVFGVIGNSNNICNINYLDISEGSEAFIDGVFISGALSIYHSDLILKNSKIYNNFADDGLNVKYSHIEIKNNEFNNNFADQVDLDFATGIVSENNFIGSTNKDSNGDGLDLSGSYILIHNNNFTSNKDKGLSIGENTCAIITSNKIKNNYLGIAAKDSSRILIKDNEFIENNTAITGYQKKSIFNGGTIYMLNNFFDNNKQKIDLDSFSKSFEIKETKELSFQIDQLYSENNKISNKQYITNIFKQID